MSLSRDVKEKIRQTYLTPLLNRANEAGISSAEAIRTMLALFHRYKARVLDKDALAQIANADVSFQGNSLLTLPSCQAVLLAAAKFYFDPATQKEVAPSDKPAENPVKASADLGISQMVKNLVGDTSSIQMQTEFRDICHEELDPLPGMSERYIRAELAKSVHDNPTIMYALSAPIYLKKTKMFCVSVTREEIPTEEILITRGSWVIMFPTLYQATEHAMYNYRISKEKYLTPVWAVNYKEGLDNFKYIESVDGGGTRPMMFTRSMRVDNEFITPVRGVLVRPGSAFADYQMWNEIELQQTNPSQQTHKSEKKRI